MSKIITTILNICKTAIFSLIAWLLVDDALIAQQDYGQPNAPYFYGQQVQESPLQQTPSSQFQSYESTQQPLWQTIPYNSPQPLTTGTPNYPTTETGYPRILKEPLVDDFNQPLDLIVGQPFEPEFAPPQEGRSGIFQRISFLGTWLPTFGDGLSGGDFGITNLEATATFGFPFPTRESPLLITPLFGVSYLEGPITPDMPSRLYDTSIEFRWLKRFNDRWAVDVAISPGVHSDFEKSDDDAVRLPGRGLMVYQWSPITKVVMGVAYYDREDIKISPVGGLIIEPSNDIKLELIFPTPRIAQKIYEINSWHKVNFWHYLSAEFGGGSYSIQRASGMQDVVTLSDYRMIYGIERIEGLSKTRIELAYVFSRELEYKSGTPTFNPDDTLFLRFGISY